MTWYYRNTVLALCTVAFFITYFARVAISPVVPFITEDLAISNTLIGIALSGMWITYGLTQYPSGILADRFGEKRIILVSVGGTALLSFLTAIAPVFFVFFVCVVGMGAVAGLHYTVASTLLSRIYDETGTAIGIHSLGAPAAGLLAPLLSAWVGVTFGWRPALALVVLFAVPVFVAFALRVRPTRSRRSADEAADRESIDSFASFLLRPPIAFSALVAIVAMFGINGLISFLPTFLVEYHAYTPTLAGILFSTYFVVRAGTQIGIGHVSDHYSRDTVIAGCLFVGTTGLLLFLGSPHVAVVLAAVAMFSLGSSFFTALEPKMLDSLSERERNAGFGVFRTVYVVGGSTGSVGVGLFADLFGWDISFLLITILFFVAFLLVVANIVFELGY